MTIVVLLLALFAVKHYLADWQFQTKWMVEGKRLRGVGFIIPLATHAGIHAGLTLYVVLAFAVLVSSWWIAGWALACALFDLSAHFLMDRLKGVMTRQRWTIIKTPALVNVIKPRSKIWMISWMLIDQTVHGLTYLAIVAFLLM
jgi:hypothetical protein